MEKYLTTREAMELFKVTRETIRNWRKAGMPYVQLSPLVFRYEFDKIMDWAKAREDGGGKKKADVEKNKI